MEDGIRVILTESACELIIDALTNASVNDKERSDTYFKVAGMFSDTLEKYRNERKWKK